MSIHNRSTRGMLMVFLLSLFTLEAASQVVIVMVDPVNTKTMYEGNSIHEAGFNMLRENQSRILQLQTHISYFSTMMVKRETEKMNTLLNIDDSLIIFPGRNIS